MEQDVYLRVNRRQFKCYRCQKPFCEEFNFVKKTRTYTDTELIKRKAYGLINFDNFRLRSLLSF